ncbi:MAG: hypothetical protein HY869_18265 [Chloroflexi bacterium]|nr:hypothetical protein [Chloroflexota bacterium]
MNADLRSQVRNNLSIKETDELLDIWQANDRAAWTDITFDLLEEILRERLGEVPPQVGLPTQAVAEEGKMSRNGLAEWEERLLADDNQPSFYDPIEVVSLINMLNKVALAAIVLNGFLGFSYFGKLRGVLTGFFPLADNMTMALLSFFFDFLFVAVSVGLEIVMAYFPLKALAYILRILAEMEYNSRKA